MSLSEIGDPKDTTESSRLVRGNKYKNANRAYKTIMLRSTTDIMTIRDFVKKEFFRKVSTTIINIGRAQKVLFVHYYFCTNFDNFHSWYYEVKFITNANIKLAYCDPANPDNWNKYCYILIHGCNIPPELDPQCWWENIGRKTLHNQVVSLRNDRLQELKWSFFGENKTMFGKFYLLLCF